MTTVAGKMRCLLSYVGSCTRELWSGFEVFRSHVGGLQRLH